MTEAESRFQHFINIVVGGSGLLYGYFRYFVVSRDPYSPASHPLETWMQAAHIFLAPLLVFGVGLIWNHHIWENYRNSLSTKRFSGISLALLFVPMVATGYLVQISVDDDWRKAWSVAHWGTSLLIETILHNHILSIHQFLIF